MSEKLNNIKNRTLSIAAEAFLTERNQPQAIEKLQEYLELTARTPEQRREFLTQLHIEVKSLVRASTESKRRELETMSVEHKINLRTAEIYGDVVEALVINEAPDSTVDELANDHGEQARRLL